MTIGTSARKPVPAGAEDSTQTTEGLIPHLAFRGLRCPVMLAVVQAKGERGKVLATNWKGTPRPMRAGNGYRYALPGGYWVEGPRS